MSPIPPIYREREVSFMVRHARSKMLFVPDSFKGFDHATLGRNVLKDVETLEHLCVVGGKSAQCLDLENDFLKPEWEKEPGLLDELERRTPGADDVAALLFTSGTTGSPKAAMHTYNTIWSTGRALPEAIELTSEDVAFMASTVGHLTGFYWGTMLPLSTGQKLVYQDVWDPDQMLDLIESEGVTWTLSATPFATDLVEASKRRKRSTASLRAFACGGATIPPQVARDFKDEFQVGLISLWGCTEVGICSIHQAGAPVEVLAASDGMPVDWMDVRIADDNGVLVKNGDAGGLHVKGPNIFAGYYKQSDLTEEMKTPDGWFDTGDQGYRTPDGGIRISGRTKDIIIRGGQNIPVIEIENEILKMEQVSDVAVIGVPDPRMGERGCAVLVTDDANITLGDVQERLAEAGMAKQFWPEFVEVLDEMPRTPAGKIKKYELKDRFACLGETYGS